ncbi:MAG: hypothetical protein GTO45_05210 [Candidatus Aminicenantes bacterium]|nr:hypothetical protein [Candidatus Aminicenantes bacterium]NIM78150.1 hypothetical protein [Candidatus Aminicenantes bacterium]NIN17474.1 hypothetical protein [Candidatus Aminicenantes bacterium]NIN41370.1 hypothetical protein [Candidatus Aminicenantes bacterium]NIN84136.1 hypothetical protein [Candidatus Aminicenantes bacterium]
MIFKIFDCNSERQTIIQAEKPEAKLPQFILCPNRFMNRIDQRRKLQKFSFDNDPDFSKMFILRGKGQKKINQTFSPEVRQYLKDLPLKFYLEGLNDKLIFYKPVKRLKPTDLQPFYHQFKELVPYFFRERGHG